MSERKRRTISRPASYKEFNETGDRDMQNDGGGDANLDLDLAQDESRSSSQESSGESSQHNHSQNDDDSQEGSETCEGSASNSEESDNSEVIIKSVRSTKNLKHDKQNEEQSNAKVGQTKRGQDKHGKHAIHVNKTPSRDKKTTKATNESKITARSLELELSKAAEQKNEKSKKLVVNKYGNVSGARPKSTKQTVHEEDQDRLDISIDPEEDDFDKDESQKQVKSVVLKTPSKKKGKIVSTPCNTSTKKRQTVANRVKQWPSPSMLNNSNASITSSYANNGESIFQIEYDRADRDANAAREMLAHAEREAQIVKKRVQAESARKKAEQIRKQTEKDKKKVEAGEKARYGKTGTNRPKTNVTKATTNKNNVGHQTIYRSPTKGDNNTHNDHEDDLSEGEIKIKKAKKRAKQMNPLRRARMLHTDMHGNNNPNIAGQDNGLNAWLDIHLNSDTIDHDLENDARYAKRNLDRNRFFDIDDIPIKGPPNYDDIPSDISENEATKLANELINDDELYICRKSGMRKHEREKLRERYEPVPTTSRPAQRDDYRSYHGNNSSYKITKEREEVRINTETITGTKMISKTSTMDGIACIAMTLRVITNQHIAQRINAPINSKTQKLKNKLISDLITEVWLPEKIQATHGKISGKQTTGRGNSSRTTDDATMKDMSKEVMHTIQTVPMSH